MVGLVCGIEWGNRIFGEIVVELGGFDVFIFEYV